MQHYAFPAEAADSPHHYPPNDYGDFGLLYNRPMQMPPQPVHHLVMPQWPSQITNPSESSSPPPVVQLSRRTLTDSDRRKMCEYHEENANVNQTEIGAMFGVERRFVNPSLLPQEQMMMLIHAVLSTVSKVLRKKAKYLVPREGNSDFPDVERTLSKWVNNRISQRLPLDDSTIRDKARMFVTTVGSSECHDQVNDPTWLEQFKQKNNLDSNTSFASDLPAQKMARLLLPAPTSSLQRRQTVPLMSSESSPDSTTSTLDISVTDPSLHASRPSNLSPLSMASNPSSAISASPLTSNNLPSQDEARTALFTLMTFIKHQPNGAVDPHDYLVMGKWMHMLKLETGELLGGMQGIHQQHPMQGSERADGTVPIGRKRSEHSLS